MINKIDSINKPKSFNFYIYLNGNSDQKDIKINLMKLKVHQIKLIFCDRNFFPKK